MELDRLYPDPADLDELATVEALVRDDPQLQAELKTVEELKAIISPRHHWKVVQNGYFCANFNLPWYPTVKFHDSAERNRYWML
ncbi:uncharacterized protein N7482_005923 [Penicillium canariense]|uniref:Uncharacterized protein n=1 Tax=Penicillium canariense TaxID=189055 RepID=A0A9W9LN02_9EURO|nr:uncharacterized protein N7482_005923 [Penicillium canariense]KAJ5167142.1 hypothetical protein N7482_005923 [Penicillium canariense]